jgi:F420-non-reducing hydrogenase iron-sulfur subunit
MNNEVVNITLFYCSNSYSAEEIHYCATKTDNIKLNAISLPCSGRVNLLYLLKAVETGSDGVILLTCKVGECRFLQGNLRAQKRIEAIDDLLDEAGIGRGYIKCLQLQEGQSADTLADEINNFMKHLKPNLQSIKQKI